MTRTRVATIAAVVAACLGASFTGAMASYGSLEEAKAASAAAHKPLLLDFYATWCGPCKEFTRASKEDADVQKTLSGVVLYKIECDTNGKDLATAFSIKGYPTFVLCDANAEPIYRWMGYAKGQFQETMALAMSDRTTVNQKLARFEARPNETDAVSLARYKESMGEYETAIGFYGKAAGLSSSSDYAREIFETTAFAFRKGGDVTAEQARAAADAVFASPKATPSDLFMVLQMSGPIADKTGDTTMMDRYLRIAFDRSEKSQDEAVLAARKELLPEYTLKIERNADRAVELKRAALPTGWEESPQQLNGFAWWCFENKVNLKEALDVAARGAKLAQAGKERGMILDTQAEICNALADCRNAVTLSRQALKEDPENQYYKEQVTRFEKLLAEKN